LSFFLADEAEGMMIGVEKMDDTAILAAASSITERTQET